MAQKQVYLESKPRYEILDGLRGVASVIVVIFHIFESYSAGPAYQFINHGYLAVDFFFALSGFVIRSMRAFPSDRECSGMESRARFRDGLPDDSLRYAYGHQGLGRIQLFQRAELVSDVGVPWEYPVCIHFQKIAEYRPWLAGRCGRFPDA